MSAPPHALDRIAQRLDPADETPAAKIGPRARSATLLQIAIYARTATDDFRVVDAEIARLRALVERRAPAHRTIEMSGWPEIVSTGLGQPGPVLARLLDEARLGRIDVVVVPTLAHLALTTRRREDIIQSLNVLGAHVVTEDQIARWPKRAGVAA